MGAHVCGSLSLWVLGTKATSIYSWTLVLVHIDIVVIGHHQ